MDRADYLVLGLICVGAAMTRFEDLVLAIEDKNWLLAAWFVLLIAIAVGYAVKTTRKALSE